MERTVEAGTEEKQEQREERDDGEGAVGRIAEVQGVVIEAVFPDDQLP